MSLYVGLMSGTSADGVDAALVDFSLSAPRLIASLATPYPSELKAKIIELYTPAANEIDRMGALDRKLGVFFGRCVNALIANAKLSAEQITAIGSHGQTIRHRPKSQSNTPFTVQIGDPNTIANETGIRTIADFRRRDIAAGGQGAPLTPAFHQAMFSHKTETRAVLNIGGIANITCLSAKHGVIGFDTGPGNGLMDAWILHNQNKPYDLNGNWASTGVIDHTLLNTLLEHSYFEMAPPKSTGREEFSFSWLLDCLKQHSETPANNIQATLLAFTAQTIANAIDRYVAPQATVYVCGGGIHNQALMNMLTKQLPKHYLGNTETLGVSPDWVEAMAFAWLAKQTWNGLAGNAPSVTGASRAVILGGVYPPG